MLPAFHAKGSSTQGGDVTVVKSNGIPEKTNKSEVQISFTETFHILMHDRLERDHLKKSGNWMSDQDESQPSCEFQVGFPWLKDTRLDIHTRVVRYRIQGRVEEWIKRSLLML